jgi:hypothetical protein
VEDGNPKLSDSPAVLDFCSGLGLAVTSRSVGCFTRATFSKEHRHALMERSGAASRQLNLMEVTGTIYCFAVVRKALNQRL